MSLALSAYRLFTGLAAPLAPALLTRRSARGKEDPARLRERLGEAGHARPPGSLIWMHGASVGEGLSLIPLVEAVRTRRPEVHLLVTSGTVTSAELLARRLPAGVVHQYLPVDTPGASARFIQHWRPQLAVFAESEIWPNLLLAARGQGARTALVSARLSPSSVAGWSRVRSAARQVFGGFDVVLGQDEAAAKALVGLGARDDGRLNLKLMGEPLPADALALGATRALVRDRSLVLAVSTHPGEEELVLEVFARLEHRSDRALLVIVPRHPVRGSAIAELVRAQGLRVARRAIDEPLSVATQVYVADTLGELGLWFRLARMALIGGSLVGGIGGHNPLEAARLDCPVVCGPHVENWRGVYEALGAAQGFRCVRGGAALAGVMAEALSDPAELMAQGSRAKAFAGRQAAAIEPACDRLLALIDHDRIIA